MKNLKIALYQFNSRVGDICYNADKLIEAATTARDNGCSLFVAPELALSGYPAKDLYLRPDFYSKLLIQLERFKTVHGVTMLIGCPYRHQYFSSSNNYSMTNHPKYRSIAYNNSSDYDGANDHNHVNYNSAFVFRDGVILGRYDKSILPNYGVFDECRYFQSGTDSSGTDTSGLKPLVIDCCGVKLGILICEDVWQSEPALAAKMAGSEVLCVLNSSPYDITKQQRRLQATTSRVNETGLPLIYLNQCGAQDELVFDGASFVLNAQGDLKVQLPAFNEELAYFDYADINNVSGKDGVGSKDINNSSKDGKESQSQNNTMAVYPTQVESIYSALVIAVRDYVTKNRFAGVLLGLSGGIDSALTLAIACDALGAERVMAVMMPSVYTADISLVDARDMVNRLKVKYEEIPITSIVKQFEIELQNVFPKLENLDPNTLSITQENLQARTRGVLLMALSNRLKYLVLTTGNKSEMATGYATLYGDMAGGFAVLKDVLKTQVYQLSNWRNQVEEIIPQRIISRPPSAELRDNQTDQDSLPDYAVLDQIIVLFVEKLLSREEIISRGFKPDVVDKVTKLLKLNEYKRYQAAVGPKISLSAFNYDWRYPITNNFNY
ncbi:MAG: hypothetical protein QG673_447 [Pseudomonadota bacterium]|nr:hypothetical protein [Pseudomonadota bacterium]